MSYLSLWRIFLLSMMWAPSFLLVKMGVQDIPPMSLAFLRIGLAALCLAILLGVQGYSFPKFGAIWGHLTILAIFSLALPFVLMNYSIQHIDTGLAGIINGTVPMVTAILAHYFITSERLTTARIAGVLAGTVGFFLLLLPAMMDSDGLVDAYSMMLCALAAVSYAGGIVYGRLHIHTAMDVSLPTLQLTIATVILLPLALIIDQPWTLPMPGMASLLAVLGLATWGTALAIIYFYRVLVYDGAVALSTVVFILPLFTILFGWLFLGEELAWHTYVALGLVLFGMTLINGMIKFPPPRDDRP